MSFQSADILECYNTSYEKARHAFLDAAHEQGVEVASFLNPCGKGAAGEGLYMDIAVIGQAGFESALIVSSGTHGIEGYAGSALQVGMLRGGLAELAPASTACYLVHAVNPFGFSYQRRVNEDNVDLNRNFIDFSRPLPSSDASAEFRAYADREMEEGRAADEMAAAARYFEAVGETRYQRSLTMGQYFDPTSIYYGGRKAVWSNRTWRRFLDAVLRTKSLAIHMDIHTGLGSYGEETLIYTRNPKAPGFELARRCFGKSDLLIPGDAITPDVSGPIPSSFAEFEDDMPVLGVAPEFGTVPLNEMLSALIEENANWQAGNRNEPGRQAIVKRMMECFCPKDRDWRIRVWRQFKRRIDQSIEFLNNQ